MRFRCSPFLLSLAAGTCVTMATVASTLTFARQRSEELARSSATAAPVTDPIPEQRLREGSAVDAVGKFRVTGDRITFYPNDSSSSYRALENLALERIAKIIGETRGDREWIVSGTVTEYRGGNYLLVGRCLLKTSTE